MREPVKTILQDLLQCRTLSRDEAYEIMHRIANDEFNQSQLASLLTVMMMRHITVDELTGFRAAILELCKKVDLADFEPIDVCGTGGDGKNTFNISTLTAFVLAGTGLKVAKHGNYGVSSVSGSSNMLEHFGYQFSNDPSKLQREIDRTGICFLHAPLFHTALKAVAPVRKQLGVRTFFNMLGPLVNPCNPPVQVSGVFNFELQRIYQFIFQDERRAYAVIHNTDGYDEISLTAPAKVCTEQGEHFFTPEDLGFDLLRPEELFGGDSVQDAATIFEKVLSNQCSKAQKNAVVANAMVAYHVYTKKPLEQCKTLVTEAIESGKVYSCFSELIKMQ